MGRIVFTADEAVAQAGKYPVILVRKETVPDDIHGMEVAKEILAIEPKQRVLFASAYVLETLVDSVKNLQKVVELIQKPFELDAFVDLIEDKGIYSELETLNVNAKEIKDLNPTHQQVQDLLEGLKKLQKGRTL